MESVRSWEIPLEIFFSVCILLTFITEYTPDGETVPIRDFMVIAEIYLKSNFIFDFLPIIPFARILKELTEYAHIMYLIKLMRLWKNFDVLNT